jgi:hypothetical protein
MTSQRKHLTYANVVATLALIVAVAGIPSAIAITSKLKKNSVGTKQIKNGSITAAKIADGNVTGPKLAPITVEQALRTGIDAQAGCPTVGQRLLGGGAEAVNGGSLTASAAANGTAAVWTVGSFGSPTTFAQALCLSGTPAK